MWGWVLGLILVGLASPSELTLDQAVALAVSQHPGVARAASRVTEAESERALVTSVLFPRVDLSFNPATQKDSVLQPFAFFGGDPYNQYTWGLRFSQPITSGGGEWAAIAAAKKNTEIEELSLEIAKRDVGLRALKSYVAVLANQERLRILERSETIQKEIEEIATKKRRVGRTALLELLDVQTASALIQPKLVRARANLAISVQDLATAVGLESSSVVLSTNLDAMGEGARKISISDSAVKPEEASLLLRQSQLADERAKLLSTHLPKLSFEAEYGRRGFAFAESLSPSATTWSLGLKVTIPLFSGLSSFHERDKMAAKGVGVEAELRSLRAETVLAQMRSERELASGIEQMTACKKARLLAERAVAEAKSGYRDGRYDYLKFFNAEAQLVQALLDERQAIHDTVVAVAERALASGARLDQVVEGLVREGIKQ